MTATSRKRPTREERFWSRVEKGGPEHCWLWTGGKRGGNQRTGRACYGAFRFDSSRLVYAHRYSYALARGWDVTKMQETTIVRHTCDNPLCVNPAHLVVGDVTDNNRDTAKRGRCRNGSTGPRDWWEE